ncbi:MAG: PBP1A family penicillin-binding protein [Oscillospiraceae bacterium]
MENGKPERTHREAPHKARQSTGRKHRGRVGFILGTLALIFVVTCVMFACIFMIYVKTALADEVAINAEEYTMELSSMMYYEETPGNWTELKTLHGKENRIWVDYEKMPKALTQAAIAIEDKRFMTHHGVDWWRTGQAVTNMFFGMKNTFGGSTITQQLIKNMTHDDEGTVKRKVTEMFRALEFEKNYSKDEIMELYLNTIFLGYGRNGVQTASQLYFGKDVSALTTAECASLIGITNNPWVYDPLRNEKSLANNKKRQQLILDAMLEQEMISDSEYGAAVAQELVFTDDATAPDTEEDVSNINSYFEDQVINDVRDDLMAEKGLSEEAATHLLFYGGYRIYTTVDKEIQEIAESVYEDRGNLDYTSKNGARLQSAITIIDPETGNVVAMVGGVGPKEGSRVMNRATRLRQCGSSIKPIASYAPALDAGVITMASVIDSCPVRLLNGNPWPKNSGGAYGGLTTLSAAVAGSINTVAVRVIESLGVSNSYSFLTDKLGITSLVSDDLNSASLGLGGLTKGVTTEEMAAAFAAFPNHGIYTAPRTYVKVTDAAGNIILDKTPKSVVAMKETTAYFINQLLTGAVTGGTGGGAAFSGMTVAGKTGTTSENYDRYFAGYTPYYCAAVWCGYDQNEKISTPVNPSAALWRKVMSKIHADLPNKKFDVPTTGLTQVTVCMDSGLLATAACGNDLRGSRVHTVTVAAGTEPTATCNLHQDIQYCTEGKCIAGDFCPESTVAVKSALNYSRETFGVAVGDSAYLLTSLEALGACPVHTTAIAPPIDETVPPTEGGTPPGHSGDAATDDWWNDLWGPAPTEPTPPPPPVTPPAEPAA